jgi:hypothetical protein
MLCKETIAVFSVIHTKHVHALCKQNLEVWLLNLLAYKVKARL